MARSVGVAGLDVAAAAQEPEAVVEAGQQVGRRHRADAGRGQLDGQRDAVEAAAQPGHASRRPRRVRTAGSAATARSRNSSTPSIVGSQRLRPATSCSPRTPSGSRLVASSARPGSGRPAGGWPAPRPRRSTCSQLSSTTSSTVPWISLDDRLDEVTAVLDPGTERLGDARGRPPPAGSGGPAPTIHTPPGNSSRAAHAASTARRVLPTPPGAVSVTSRPGATSAPSALSSWTRPMNARRRLQAGCRCSVGRGERREGRAQARVRTSWCTRSGVVQAPEVVHHRARVV